MLIQLAFQKEFKHIKILNSQWAMNFWILITIFITYYKTHEIYFAMY
jgi:hypothetical protein